MPHPGLTSNYTNSLATNNAKLLKGTPGVLQCISVMNASAAAKYVRLYNKATIPVPGTDTPVVVIHIPAGTSKEIEFGSFGKVFDAGIGMAITGAAAVLDNTAIAAGDVQAAVTFIQMETTLTYIPQIVNLNVYLGQKTRVIFPFKDSSGLPLDFTGLAMLMQIKKYPTDTISIKELTNVTGLYVGAVNKSSVEAIFDVDFPVDSYVYDLVITLGDTSKVAGAKGRLINHLNVSR